jgi:hypothetical protein
MMHILLTILEVIGGLFALAVIAVLLFAFSVTRDGGNPFQ